MESRLRAFVCHSSHDSEYVLQVCAFLKRHMDVFAYEEHQRAGSFITTINEEIAAADVFLLFFGLTFEQSPYLRREVDTATVIGTTNPRIQVVPVILLETARNALPLRGLLRADLNVTAFDDRGTVAPAVCARDIVGRLRSNGVPLAWRSVDGLPFDPHLFSYEKDIIRFFTQKKDLGSTLYEEAPNEQEERHRSTLREKLGSGCPARWPTIIDLRADGFSCGLLPAYPNNRSGPAGPTMEDKTGSYRPDGAMVHVAALSDCVRSQGRIATEPMAVPEAGPRAFLRFPVSGPSGSLQAAVMVLGGIAPGINAVIDGIVQRHYLYKTFHGHTLSIDGYQNGLYGLRQDWGLPYALVPDERTLIPDRIVRATSEFANQGGSMLGTCRMDDLISEDHRLARLGHIAQQLDHVDILYMIGGDGTMKAAHALWNVALERREERRSKVPLSVVAIPKTMDNDILWMWQSFGFMSAVEKAREFIQHLHTEVNSNPRLCVLQLFGSDSGFVVSHAVLASAGGHCDVALIPEVDFSLLGVAKYLTGVICNRGKPIPSGLVVMAETAIPVDAAHYVDPANFPLPAGLSEEDRADAMAVIASLTGKSQELSAGEREVIVEFDAMRRRHARLQGQTSDVLRRAGLKIVKMGIEAILKRRRATGHVQWGELRTLSNEPRHLVRAIAPSTSDIIMGQRLGALAVDNAIAGYTDFMISQWLTEYVLVPLDLVVLGRKRIPESGIFWKSVLAKTGQPPDLVDPWPRF